MEEGFFSIWMNPLQWTDVDFKGIDEKHKELSIEDVIEFVCIPGTEIDIADFLERYKQINQEISRWALAPNEENVLEKMVWPLRQAKANYVLGNYLATVALCGMVAEMFSILLFEISNITINAHPMTERHQVNLFGKKFEKLGQATRLKILIAYELIDDELLKAFETVAASRNKYLHNWSIDYENLANEAREAYLATVAIAVRVTGQRVNAGRVNMNPAFERYLQERGAYRPKNSPEIE